jgi:glyoxylate utilization-related uncharacterized protein
MQVTRFDSARPYEAMRHHGMHALRLQGKDASALEDYWVGLSTFLPGGGAEKSAAPTAKVYVVIEGEITVTTAEGDTVLGKLDSCYLPPNTERVIENRTNRVVQMLVISPN